MSLLPGTQPYLALVDDDFHSARLMTRMLSAHGAPSIVWMGDVEAAARQLHDMQVSHSIHLPGLVVVDLKTSSTATADFIAALGGADKAKLVAVAIAASLVRSTRHALLEAGAAAVFERHSELSLYRAEAASIVAFWVRHQRLEAVGA